MQLDEILLFGNSLSYLTELVLLAIIVGTRLFIQDKPVTPFRRACAWVMLIDAVDVLLAYLLLYDGVETPFERGLLNCIDGVVLWAILAAGVKLISNVENPRRLCMFLAAPFLCILLCQLCFPGISPLPLQLAVLVVGCIEITYLFIRFLRHDHELKEQKSNIEYITASWYSLFSLLVLVELLFWFLVHYIQGPSVWLNLGYYLFLQVCYFLMAVLAIRQKTTTLQNLNEELSTTTTKPQVKPSLVTELEQLMQNNKLFRDPDLTLDRLAAELHTNNTYVYLCIHDEMSTTFYDYINGLRVEEAKQLLLSGEDTIEGIAFNSGFNSSRSFQRTFKRITGCTPTEWRKTQR